MSLLDKTADQIFETLPDDRAEAILYISDYLDECIGVTNGGGMSHSDKLTIARLEALCFALAQEWGDSVKVQISSPAAPMDRVRNINNLAQELADKYASDLALSSIDAWQERLDNKDTLTIEYPMSSGEVQSAMAIISSLELHVINMTSISEGVKNQILRRLSRLRAIISTNLTDLGYALGTVSDVTVFLSKLARDAEPAIDALGKLSQIFLNCGRVAAGLPTITVNAQLPRSSQSGATVASESPHSP